MESSIVRIGLVGYGHWGPNLLRNLVSNNGCRVVGVVDTDADARSRSTKVYPHVPTFHDLDEFLQSMKPDAMVIATPPRTHHALAISCLEAGTHILVEKPLAVSSVECNRILEFAGKKNRTVMVDHTFVYNPAVQYLAAEIHAGKMGQLLYYDSVRVNLGGFQHKTNVLWDLAPHDLSILDLFLNGELPIQVSAQGIRHFEADVENLCYLHLTYANNLVAHLHLNWVAPVKIRTVMVGGSQKMAVYDENIPAEKVRIYNKSIMLERSNSQTDFSVSYRVAEMVAPALPNTEALAGVVDDFVSSIVNGRKPVSDGEASRRIIRILETASESIANGGIRIDLRDKRVARQKL